MANAPELTYGFIFVGDPTRDEATFEIIARRAPGAYVAAVEDVRPLDRRQWEYRRYRRMVGLRNVLLRGVRHLQPKAFLSLDSDILLHPAIMPELWGLLSPNGPYDAVGGKVYLSERGVKTPNWGKIGRGGMLRRSDVFGVITVDVLMALKLMTPRAYNIDYCTRTHGEDQGWSIAARQAGLSLGFSGRLTSKHIWSPHYLDLVDERVGW